MVFKVKRKIIDGLERNYDVSVGGSYVLCERYVPVRGRRFIDSISHDVY